MARRLAPLLLTTLLLVSLTGCGQKGPLYLPDEDANAAPAEGETPSATIDQD